MAEANDQRDVRGDVRAQIREFLSSRRARITPEQAGLRCMAETAVGCRGCAAPR